MDWINLQDEAQLADIIKQSETKPQLIFKHSTRCATSSMVKNRMERSTFFPEINFYLLNLIEHRNLSLQIAELFAIHHESPQVLLIFKGQCIYDESHTAINMPEIVEIVSTH